MRAKTFRVCSVSVVAAGSLFWGLGLMPSASAKTPVPAPTAACTGHAEGHVAMHITSPTPGATIELSTAAFQFSGGLTGTHAKDIKSVEIYSDGADLGTADLGPRAHRARGWQIARSESVGTHVLLACGRTRRGRVVSASVTFTVTPSASGTPVPPTTPVTPPTTPTATPTTPTATPTTPVATPTTPVATPTTPVATPTTPVATPTTPAAPPASDNLIKDSGAEHATPDTVAGVVPVTNWTGPAGSDFTAVAYGTSGGYLTATSNGPAARGGNFFAGGPSQAVSRGSQSISLAPFATRIATGSASYALSGWLGGFSTQRDSATLTVSWQNAAGTTLGQSSVGPVTETDRGGATELLKRATTGAIPAGAATAVVTLEFDRLDGSYNDGYADNLTLTVS